MYSNIVINVRFSRPADYVLKALVFQINERVSYVFKSIVRLLTVRFNVSSSTAGVLNFVFQFGFVSFSTLFGEDYKD